MALAQRIDEATPAERDRFLDLLRVLSIVLVVLGHWTVRVVMEADGELQGRYLLALLPELEWATLVWQVMPVFFLIGGVVNASSWQRARARGEGPTTWLRGRARRLIRPAVPLLVVLVPAAAVIHRWAGADNLIFDFTVALMPLWFLAAYLLVTALTPLTLWLHDRLGGVRVIVTCTLLAMGVDVLRFTVFADGPLIGGHPAVGGINYLLVWVAIHQIGYLWAEQRLPVAVGRWWLLLGATGALALMIGSGVYPLSMVPIEGTGLPNNGTPPTAALIFLGLAQLGLALLLRGPVQRGLQRPLCWAPVALLGGCLMTVFLWHQTAMVVAAHLVYPLGWKPAPAEIDLTWWALRPLWLLVCMLLLALVVLLVRRYESPSPSQPSRLRGRAGLVLNGFGVLFTGVGLASLIQSGLYQPGMPLDLPLPSILILLAGLLALGVIGQGLTARQR